MKAAKFTNLASVRAQFKGRGLQRVIQRLAKLQESNWNIKVIALSLDRPRQFRLTIKVLLLSVGADGSLAEINTDRWRLMSLNTVNGLSPCNPVQTTPVTV